MISSNALGPPGAPGAPGEDGDDGAPGAPGAAALVDLEDSLKAEALADLQIADPKRLAWWFHPFYAKGVHGLHASAVGSGSIVRGLHLSRIAGGATMRRYMASDTGTTDAGLMVPAGAAKKIWGVVAMKQVSGLLNANEAAGLVCWSPSTGTLQWMVGMQFNAALGSNGSYTINGGTGVFMQAAGGVDLNWHKIKGYRRDGSNTVLVVDGVTVLTQAGGMRPNSDSVPGVGAGGGIGTEQADFHYAAFATETEFAFA